MYVNNQLRVRHTSRYENQIHCGKRYRGKQRLRMHQNRQKRPYRRRRGAVLLKKRHKLVEHDAPTYAESSEVA